VEGFLLAALGSVWFRGATPDGLHSPRPRPRWSWCLVEAPC
jgi:hypothetical protein